MEAVPSFSPTTQKVLAIVKEDKNRKVVVVSAPGKRTPDDTKVTDALIAYYKAYKSGKDFQEPLNWISQRYQTICQDLGIDSQVGTDITQSLEALAKLPIDHNPFYMIHSLLLEKITMLN